MGKRSILAIAVVFSLQALSFDAIACGESLFRVGKGVNYRDYTAPLPGNIIVVANTESELFMVERLAAAGHHVKVVSTPDEISELADQEDFDIVLALYAQRDTVESEINSGSLVFLPVALENTNETTQASNAYPYSLSTDDSVKKFLKTIHKTLVESQA